jgi:hypothetical protein
MGMCLTTPHPALLDHPLAKGARCLEAVPQRPLAPLGRGCQQAGEGAFRP